MIETPNPTNEELLEIDALINGDIAAAQDEAIRRLQEVLPGYIVAKNAAKGWTGNDAILPIADPKNDIAIAPSVLTDDHIGKTLVGVSVDTSPEGIGGVFRNVAQVVVYSIDERIQSDRQVRVHWRRIEAIRTVLSWFLVKPEGSGCVNASGQEVWRALEPTGYSMLPGDWAEEYSGTMATFTLTQTVSTEQEEE
jgi:hypothetical protein